MSMPALISDGRTTARAPFEVPMKFAASAAFAGDWKADLRGFFARFRAHLGKVNAAEFRGRPPGTVLLESCEASLADHVPCLNFRYRDVPWGHIPGADGAWEEYESTDFAPLVTPPRDGEADGRAWRWPWNRS